MVGCDGARSAVRKSLGRALRRRFGQPGLGRHGRAGRHRLPRHPPEVGDPVGQRRQRCSSFRAKAAISFRLYIELDKLNENERVSSLNITTDRLIAAAQRILHPYTLEVKEIAWWSVYEIGQRLATSSTTCRESDARPLPARVHRRRRLPYAQPQSRAGHERLDAGRLQSGLETGLGAARPCSPNILHTYSDERQAVAKELIDFDRELAKMFSAPPKDPSNARREGVDPAEFQKYFVKQARFTAGTETRYCPVDHLRPSRLISILPQASRSACAFIRRPVIRLADAKPVHLGHTVKADGRWRLFAFADAEDPAARSSQARALSARFSPAPIDLAVRSYTPTGADIDSVIDVRAIFQQGHRELAIEAMPLLPSAAQGPLRALSTTRRCSAPT